MSDLFTTDTFRVTPGNVNLVDVNAGAIVSKVQTRRTLYIISWLFFILSIIGLLIGNKWLWGISLIIFAILLVVASL